MHSVNRFLETRSESADPFAMQLALSRVHARLVPMRRVAGEYEIHPGAQAWAELPAARGLAGYGLGRALRMLLDVLRGLTALHDTFTADGAPFTHGEVALTQFRVDPEGVCRLVPLTSRHRSEEEGAPDAAVLGHLAPERLLGEVLDARADVFSAGTLLWEALAGRRLFEEVTSEAIIDRLMAEKLQMPQLPPELAWAIPLKSVAARALAVDPHQRFADCAELATAIAIVARERVASHAEIANFFGAAPRSMERRVRASVAPGAEEPSSMTPALLAPSSGPRSQRAESSVPPSEARERPVPSQSQTFSAVTPPASVRPKRSTLSPLGPASSRPSTIPVADATRALPETEAAAAWPVTEAAASESASDPNFTPVPRAFRSSALPPTSTRPASQPPASGRSLHKSPFSALLMPPLDPLPTFPVAAHAELELEPETELAPPSAGAEQVTSAAPSAPQGALETPMPTAESSARTSEAPRSSEAPRLSEAPRSTRLPPPLPVYARDSAFPGAAMEPVPSTKSTFTAVVAPLPVIVDDDVIDAASMFRRPPARKLWTVLAISSVSAALAVAALTHGSAPRSGPVVTIAAARPAKAPRADATPDRAPATLSAAPVGSAQAGPSNNAPKASDTHDVHSATRAKSSAASKSHAGEKDYGI